MLIRQVNKLASLLSSFSKKENKRKEEKFRKLRSSTNSSRADATRTKEKATANPQGIKAGIHKKRESAKLDLTLAKPINRRMAKKKKVEGSKCKW